MEIPKIVLGSLYGDEGKGKATSLLCSQLYQPLVVRFNGGHQAGHTVKVGDKKHVFSNYGSGSLQGAPTLWSHFCTFNPSDVIVECRALNSPYLFVHGLCPVTTPYDILANRITEASQRHGSVGLGFGKTIERQERYFKLFVQDLPFESIVREKLRNIANYYGDFKIDIEPFLMHIREALNIIDIVHDYKMLNDNNVVLEGAQGILLDQDFGFFPNVTRSNTTSKNALSLVPVADIFYTTRTYQTRHGNGFMTNEGLPLELINNENETNTFCLWQGNFRTSILDVDLLNYALTCDRNFSNDCSKNLVISCVDQTGYDFDVTVKGIKQRINLSDLPKMLDCKFDKIYFSKGESYEDIELM